VSKRAWHLWSDRRWHRPWEKRGTRSETSLHFPL